MMTSSQVCYHSKVKLLYGSDLAAFIKERQAKQVRQLRQAYGIFPRLAIVTDAKNPVIDVYMRLKERYGEDILIDVEIHRVTPEETVETIRELNQRADVQGIIVQLPLADTERTDEVLSEVDVSKDVDGLHRDSKFDAATPMAIGWLLVGHGIEISKKRVAIVGRGRLVGAPLEKMWQSTGVKMKLFSRGNDLAELADYDVVVTATGSPHLINSSMIKNGAIIVDAGTAVEDGVVRGDVAEDVRERDDISITPEKGGVGPLTVAALFDNVITACYRLIESK